MLLKDYKGLVLPPPSYFSYEPLPESWEKILDRPDVAHPHHLTPEMEEFATLPTYKKEAIMDAGRPMTSFKKNRTSKDHLDYIADQGSSQYRSDYSVSGENSTGNDDLRTKRKYESSKNLKNISYQSQEASKHAKSKQRLSQHYASDIQEDLSEKEDKTERGTQADDQDTHLRISNENLYRERRYVEDQMLMDELDSYYPKLNREVSRILNDHN